MEGRTNGFGLNTATVWPL